MTHRMTTGGTGSTVPRSERPTGTFVVTRTYKGLRVLTSHEQAAFMRGVEAVLEEEIDPRKPRKLRDVGGMQRAYMLGRDCITTCLGNPGLDMRDHILDRGYQPFGEYAS